MDAEALAKLILDTMGLNQAGHGLPWIDDEFGLTEVTIDGRFDMLKVAEVVLNAVKQTAT
jgi:hypothetical protein